MATQPEGCPTMRWVDVSMSLREGMLTWPGDPPFESRAVTKLSDGDSSNVSRLVLTTHTGTHIDAPYHFCPSGARVHELDPGVFFGKAEVVQVNGTSPAIMAGDLPSRPLPERLLLKTRNSQCESGTVFREDYVALAPDAADRLVDEGVRLVGIDSLSIGPFGDEGAITHRILLEADILVVEGLILREISAGPCEFLVAPLAIAGGDGAPCRAFVGMEAYDG